MITIIFICLTFGPLIEAHSVKISREKIGELFGIKENFFQKDVNNLIFESEYEPGEIIVKFKEKVDISIKTVGGHHRVGLESIDKLNEIYRVTSVKRISKEKSDSIFSNVYKFKVCKDMDLSLILAEYNSDPNVEYAEPNYIYHTCVVPNDSLYPIQWSLDNVGQEYPTDGRYSYPGLFDSDIDAPEAWDIETGNSSIVVAILDTGVDYEHPDLVDNIWINEGEIPNNGIDDDGNGYVDDVRGWDCPNSSRFGDGSDPMDAFGHGTHCAGTVSAVTNNSIGVAGVCWNCKIMAVRIGSYGIRLEDAVNGTVYAADNGADVISMSWGGLEESQLLKDALDYAYSKDIVLVASAGNSNVDLAFIPFYPAGYDNVIAVAATDSSDKKASFSCYGSPVDVAAPGVDILSLRAEDTDMYGDGSHIVDEEYYVSSGTSMACPHVAGLAGLILSKNPDLTPLEVKTVLRSSTDGVNSSLYAGVGRINAYKALQKAYPVIVNLDFSMDVREAKGSIDIRGTAVGEGFQQYIVEYGKGAYPDTWVEICNSTESIENDLITTWDTTVCEEIFYTIRLKVIYDNGTYEDRVSFLVNNFVNTLYVDDDGDEDFSSIQAAVDSAGNDDIVYVFNGTYHEEILVIKPISLIGENKETTIIEASVLALNILGDGFKVSGFTFLSWGIAIMVQSHNVTITDNIIQSPWPHWSDGIFVLGPSGITISYNTIKETLTGILFVSEGNSIIHHNNFIDNLDHIESLLLVVGSLKDLRNSKNKYYENYWDDWIGLKYRIFKRAPKRIEKQVLWLWVTQIGIFSKRDIGLPIAFLSAYDFDWHPTSEPYDYGGGI